MDISKEKSKAEKYVYDATLNGGEREDGLCFHMCMFMHRKGPEESVDSLTVVTSGR